ncbi:MAG: TIGR01212 family radical SAM protein [Lachnospiraceae bacterium]|nr:TIGR01212 family radical SAM protein [Lachnospiraceae bacterium]MBR3004331.1 TIGR01212 family radical SAM protein [Lachnospiraceae bacterium]
MYTIDQYLKEKYGEKVYKLALDGGMNCPNRDGRVGRDGCIFCSMGGSGEFTSPDVDTAIKKLRANGKQVGNKFIAYYQSYTNTYAPPTYLLQLYLPVIYRKDIVGMAIGTRPDCLWPFALDVLDKLNKIKPTWVELGLQTIHERTAEFIKRGYSLPVFDEAVKNLRERNIDVVVHLILGLPGETKEDMLESVRYLNQSGVQGVKLQLLHVLRGTALGDMYEADPSSVPVMSLEEYTDLVCDCLEVLDKNIVVHRITGDGPKNLLLAPKWSEDKKNVLNTLNKEIARRGL